MQAGSTKKTKDSAGRRLGLKKFGGEEVFPDEIILRQRGFKWHPGRNTYSGKDHTIHSKIEVSVIWDFYSYDDKGKSNIWKGYVEKRKKVFCAYWTLRERE